MLVSLVVPVYRDTEALRALLAQLAPVPPEVQVIVVTAGDVDDELSCIRTSRSDVMWREAPRGRGQQLNAGAAVASGRWLWFVHADSRLPARWLNVFDVIDREAPGPVGGSFRFGLLSDAWQARLLERLVAVRTRWLGLPYGDQGIFARRTVFQQMGGYAAIPLMEDVEFVRRLTRAGTMRHLTVELQTSARRWVDEGWWRRSARNVATMGLYLAGVSPDRLAKRYDRR